MAVPYQGHPDLVAGAQQTNGPRRGRDHAESGAGGQSGAARGSGPFAVRARVSVHPWTDAAFAGDVRDVMRVVSLSEAVVLGTGTGAVLAERLLRERGYLRARVIDARTADEAMRRIAHWRVVRDGDAAASPD